MKILEFSGRVTVEHMEEKILYCQQLGFTVFFVGITAGTTVLGAFDRIEEIAFICRKYKIWLHVDVNSFFHVTSN
jgi:glutamate/tyrosine decarboxylase-like PLP-dependent enzyme